MIQPLIDAPTLFQELQQRNIKVVRALIKDPTTGQEDVADQHFLPNTINFDIDTQGSDSNSRLPHAMPTTADLAHTLGLAGISQHDDLVVYDNRGMFSAPRLWWMLKALGHKKVRILNGGMPAWAARFPLESAPAVWPVCDYQATPQPGWFATQKELIAAQAAGAQVLDARSAERFFARAPEPRPGVRGGHIPGSLNLHYARLLNHGRLLDSSGLETAFAAQGVDMRKPIICSCGSGITACILGVAAKLCGASEVSVYDGSWTEWGSTPGLAVAGDAL